MENIRTLDGLILAEKKPILIGRMLSQETRDEMEELFSSAKMVLSNPELWKSKRDYLLRQICQGISKIAHAGHEMAASNYLARYEALETKFRYAIN